MKRIANRSCEVIEKLCDYLIRDDIYKKLPKEFLRWEYESKSSEKIKKLRIISDYVSRLTDSQADKYYQRIYGAYRAPKFDGDFLSLI